MFNRELKHKIAELDFELKEAKKWIYCLRGSHTWIVAQGMTIRCQICHKQADKMPDAGNTQPGDQKP